MKRIQLYILFITIISATAFSAEGVTTPRSVSIDGLEIFKENILKSAITPTNTSLGSLSFRDIADKISAFYYQRGYYLVTVYLIEETREDTHIYVDEGHLGQIVFLGLDDVTLIRIKSSFELPHKIYHKQTIDKEMARLKTKFGFKDLTFNIIPAPDYNSKFVQIDDILKLPFFNNAQNLPFYDRYGYRYNMEIHQQSYTKQEAELSQKGFSYNIKLFYIGIKPIVGYVRPNLFLEHDKAEVVLSGGINYLTTFNPSKAPSIGFLDSDFIYNFPHLSHDIFIPRTDLDLYYTHGIRPDIGLTSFDYIKDSFRFEPGFSPLASLRIYPGIGAEKVNLFNTKLDSVHVSDIHDDAILWFLASIRIDIERFLGILYPSLNRRASLSYSYYFRKQTFHQWDLSSHFDFSSFNYDILSFDFSGVYLTGDVPFYHDDPVTGGAFLGFTGQTYHTKKGIKIGSEYRTSIYRGYLFAGPYLGMTFFRAMGYNLEGNQTGLCGGIAGHYIFFDQFEFSVYFGRDYLVSTKKSEINLTFSLEKKI